MAEANPEVMALVKSELKKNPDVSNRELLDKARSVDKSIDKLSARQFNATYPLQVKRGMAPRKPRARRGTRAGGKANTASDGRGAASRQSDAARDQVRKVLLELARDIANAQGKGDVVDVIVGIDRYVDRVVKATA